MDMHIHVFLSSLFSPSVLRFVLDFGSHYAVSCMYLNEFLRLCSA
jgi:hypothetical protein